MLFILALNLKDPNVHQYENEEKKWCVWIYKKEQTSD